MPGFDPPVTPFGDGEEAQIEAVVGWLLTHRRPLDVGDLHHPALTTILAKQGVELCIPVLQEEKPVGLLCLSEKKRGGSFFF